MNSPRLSLLKCGVVLAVLFLFFGMSSAKPALAVTSEEIIQVSENLESDSGALAAAAELAGADSELFNKFQTGVKYGEFASRLWQGDYWGVAVDFVKFKLGEEWDELTDRATKKLLSEGAQKLLGTFTALKDIGEWAGDKALNIEFSNGIKAGWQTYKENVGGSDLSDLQIMMDIWWNQYGNNAKLNELGDVFVWKEKFAKVYELQKKTEEKPATSQEVAKVQKEIKKSAVISFFKIKYPGIGENVAEEFAEAIANKDASAIKAIAEKYKNHLDLLTAAGAEGGAVSSGDICGAVKDKDDRKDCEEFLMKIVNERKQILSNRTTYDSNFWQYQLRSNYRWGINEENLTKFKKGQIDIIASAYEIQFGREIRDISASLYANKDALQSLKSDYKNIPGKGDRRNAPSYRVSVNTGFAGFFNNVYNMAFHYGSFDYGDFKSESAQKHYEGYLENEPKANAADDTRARYLKAFLARANGLVRDLAFLQNRINSLISSAESAKGVFSYGQATIDDLKKMLSEIEELKENVQSGEQFFWMRYGAWSINSVSEAIKGMESDKKARESSIDQLKRDYALALKTYENEEKQRELEKQKQAEEEKKAAAEKEAQALQKQRSEEEAWNKEKERMEAERKAAAEKIRLEAEQRTKAFNVPLEESEKTSNTVAPKTGNTKTVAPQTKPTPPPAQPPTQTKSTIKAWLGNIPAETEEMAGFSFITGFKADMMVSDFFWNDVIYTVNGALDLGFKSIDDVTSVPTSGYEQADNPQPEVGHVYAIKTRDGKYGVIEIKFIETDPGRLVFLWKYQPNGSTSF